MAKLGPTVTLTFAGDAKNLKDTVKEVQTFTKTVDTGFTKAGIAAGGFAAAGVAAGGIAAGGVLGLVGAFGALGFAALKANDEVSKTLESTGKTISEKFGQLAMPLVEPIKAASGEVVKLLDTIGPALTSMFQSMGPMIASLTAGFTGFVEGAMPGFQAAFEAAQPIVDALSAGLAQLGPALGAMFENMVGGADGAQRLADSLGQMFDLIAWGLPHIGTLIGFLAQWGPTLLPVAIGIGAVVAGIKLWTLAQVALNFAMTANPIGLIIVGIGALIAAVIWAWRNFEGFRNVVMTVWNAVKSAFTAGVNWVRTALSSAVSFIASLPGRIRSALGNMGGLLIGAGRSLVDGFLNGIRGAWGRVVGFVRQGMQWVRNLFPFSPAKDGPFSGLGYTTHSGKALAEDFAKGIRSAEGSVRTAATGVLDSASVALRAESASAVAAGGGMSSRATAVTFHGNTSDALARVIQQMIRTGQIQIT